MANYAAVDGDGLIVGWLVWDGVAEYTPPEGTTLVQLDNAAPGCTYILGVLSAIPAPPDEEL